MKRRSFINQSLIGSLGATALFESQHSFLNSKEANKNTFTLDFGFHDGMFKYHGGDKFVDQIKWAYDQGFRSIEDNGMMGQFIVNPPTSSVAENDLNNDSRIFPNPVVENLNLFLSSENSTIHQITIRNEIGQTIFQTKSSENNLTIPAVDFGAGLYFIEVIDEKGNVTTKKFFKL